MTSVPAANLTLTSSDTLRWYRSSESAQRGFCGVCGGNLFWKPAAEERIAVTAGTLDAPTSIVMAEHIFVADKSDYYSISDNLPKKNHWD